jgi:coiled-coil domain-containing protein 130
MVCTPHCFITCPGLTLFSDSEAASKPVDPLASLEKTTAAKTLATTVTAPRLEELYDLSDKYNADPYTHSKRSRRYFREEKKIEKAIEAADTKIKDPFALPKELKLVKEAEVVEEAKESWKLNRAQASLEKESSLFPKRTFAQAVRASHGTIKDSSVERRAKSLPSNRQASTLGAILLRNTIRSGKKQASDSKSLGITVKR